MERRGLQREPSLPRLLPTEAHHGPDLGFGRALDHQRDRHGVLCDQPEPRGPLVLLGVGARDHRVLGSRSLLVDREVPGVLGSGRWLQVRRKFVHLRHGARHVQPGLPQPVRGGLLQVRRLRKELPLRGLGVRRDVRAGGAALKQQLRLPP